MTFTPEEDAILLAHYPGGGARACRSLLPGRTTQEISDRAYYLDLRAANSVWTEDKVESLVFLTRQGLTARQIGDELGVSRNAVIGKWHRSSIIPKREPNRAGRPLKLARPPKQPRQSTMRVIPVREVPAREAPPLVAAAYNATVLDGADIPAAQRKGLLELEHGDCRWPCGDPRDRGFFYCGETAEKGQSYCRVHCHVAFTGYGRAPVRVWRGEAV